nr:hypothetical protein [Streptomyces sp. H27-D2]
MRIAKDVLCAGASAKICLPDGPEEAARALARRGNRRPVVIGDDRALLRAVALLHRDRALTDATLALIPIGATPTVALARALGVPTGAVAAARAVLDGVDKQLDLLVDDSGGVVLGGLRIPALPPSSADRTAHQPWWAPSVRTYRTLVRTLSGPVPVLGSLPGVRRAADDGGGEERPGGPAGLPAPAGPERNGHGPSSQRLRIEADGVLLIDLDRAVEDIAVSTSGLAPAMRGGSDGYGDGSGGSDDASGADGSGGGLVHVSIRWRPDGDRAGIAQTMTARARSLTVSGPDFHYRADAIVGGPVRARTWTVQPGAWRLTLPKG